MKNDIIKENRNGMTIISCANGHYITRFKEDDNILSFSATKKIFVKEGTVVEGIRCITDKEYNELMASKTEALKNVDVMDEEDIIRRDEMDDIKLGE